MPARRSQLLFLQSPSPEKLEAESSSAHRSADERSPPEESRLSSLVRSAEASIHDIPTDSDDAYSEDDSGDELPNVADTIARVKKVQKNPDISATPRNPARMKKGTGLIKARHNVLANSSNALSVVAPVKGTPRAKSKRGGRKRTLKDPNAPKKPLTAYFCFLRRARAQQAEEKSRAKSTKELSEAWKKLSDDEKKSLSAEADIEKARYRSERKEYEDSGAKARWEAQHPPQIYKNVAKKVKKREMRDPDRPKRSASAFFLFCAAKREESRAESSKAPTASELGKLWAALAQEEKLTFTSRAEAGKKSYETAIKEYTESGAKARWDAHLKTLKDKSGLDEKRKKKQAQKKSTLVSTKKRRPRDPAAPKKPPSAFQCFRKTSLRQKSNDAQDRAKIKKIWAKMAAEEKEPFEIEAKTFASSYEKSKREYVVSGKSEAWALVCSKNESDPLTVQESRSAFQLYLRRILPKIQRKMSGICESDAKIVAKGQWDQLTSTSQRQYLNPAEHSIVVYPESGWKKADQEQFFTWLDEHRGEITSGGKPIKASVFLLRSFDEWSSQIQQKKSLLCTVSGGSPRKTRKLKHSRKRKNTSQVESTPIVYTRKFAKSNRGERSFKRQVKVLVEEQHNQD